MIVLVAFGNLRVCEDEWNPNVALSTCLASLVHTFHLTKIVALIFRARPHWQGPLAASVRRLHGENVATYEHLNTKKKVLSVFPKPPRLKFESEDLFLKVLRDLQHADSIIRSHLSALSSRLRGHICVLTETLHHYSSRGVHDSLAADYTLAPPQGRSVDENDEQCGRWWDLFPQNSWTSLILGVRYWAFHGGRSLYIRQYLAPSSQIGDCWRKLNHATYDPFRFGFSNFGWAARM